LAQRHLTALPRTRTLRNNRTHTERTTMPRKYRNKIVAGLAVAALLLTGTGCAKRTIDPAATGSVEVEGTDGSLMKFCDGTILIYWTPNIAAGGEDDYEFIVYDGCTPDGQIINGDNARTRPRTEDLQQDDDKD
jgi:hypothetical protein